MIIQEILTFACMFRYSRPNGLSTFSVPSKYRPNQMQICSPPNVEYRYFQLHVHVNTLFIMKTCPCNTSRFFSPVKIENFIGFLKNIFLIFAQNIDFGYTLEPPRRGGSNEYPQSMFWSKNKKNRYTPVYPSFAI